MADLRSALRSLRQKSSALPSPLPPPPQDSKDPAISQKAERSFNTSHAFEDFLSEDDDLFKNIDMNDFDDVMATPTNTSQSSEINSRPSSRRKISQTGWTSSDEPSNKRPLAETNHYVSNIKFTTCMPRSGGDRGNVSQVTSNLSSQSINDHSVLATPISSRTVPSISLSLTTPSCTTPLQNLTQFTSPNVTRKFPGPAGCLPPLDSLDRLNDIRIKTPSFSTPSSTPLLKNLASVSSTVHDFDFSQPPWSVMMKELDLTDSLTAALLSINIVNVLRQARRRQLVNGKVPHLCVLVKSLVCGSTRNGTAVLIDPTGEMLAALHESVLEEYKEEFVQGCAAILRQVSVFSPSPRKHYLNVTLDNIVRVYPPNQQQQQQSRTRATIKLSAIEEQCQKENSCISSFGVQRSVSNSLFTEAIEDDEFDALFQDVDVSLLDL